MLWNRTTYRSAARARYSRFTGLRSREPKASTRYTIARHWLEAGTRTPTIGSQPKGSIRATQSPHE
ncbi:hypothetical protein VDTJJZMW_CDS_0199 [Pseudomonas phage LPS-5]